MRIGLTGKGTIGDPIAKALKALGAIVTIYDVDESVMDAAEREGFAVARSRKELLGGQDMILGATGVESIHAEDLEHLKDG